MTEQFETATVVIREMLENDIPAVLEIYAAAGLDLDERFTVDEARAHLAVFRQYPSYKVYVAELAGKVVGTYELLVMDNLAKRGKKSAIIEDVAVHPSAQGKGVGKAMMEHARESCRAQRCVKMNLSSNLTRDGAHRFYESLGFKKHGYSFLMEP